MKPLRSQARDDDHRARGRGVAARVAGVTLVALPSVIDALDFALSVTFDEHPVLGLVQVIAGLVVLVTDSVLGQRASSEPRRRRHRRPRR